MLDDMMVQCCNCQHDCWISALDRLYGSWVCYSCGTVNQYDREQVRRTDTLPCPEENDMPDTLPSGSAMTLPPRK